MRIVRPGDVYRDGFATQNDQPINADSTPTVVVYRNGTADGAVSVTVTNVGTGVYKYSFTVPIGYATDDVVQPLISAVIATVTYPAWGEPVTIGAEVSLETPSETSGRPTTLAGMMRRLFEGRHNKRTRNRTTGAKAIRNAADSADLETSTQSTASNVDTETAGA